MLYRAICAVCGDVVVRADESSLHMAGPPQTTWRCTFRCPVCRRATLWAVTSGAGHLMVAAGARVTVEPVPFAECETPHFNADGTPPDLSTQGQQAERAP